MQAEDLQMLAEIYAAHQNWTVGTVGAYAVNDGKFFSRLSAGGGCTLNTANKLVRWFSDNWPTDLEWPASIKRPAAQKRVA